MLDLFFGGYLDFPDERTRSVPGASRIHDAYKRSERQDLLNLWRALV